MTFHNLFNKNTTSFSGSVSPSKRQTTQAEATRNRKEGLALAAPDTPRHFVYQDLLGGVEAHLHPTRDILGRYNEKGFT